MGQALINCAARFPDLQVTGQVDVGDDIKSVIDNCDVVIDFSFHNATAAIAQLCASKGKSLVIGTTGHSDLERAELTTLTTKVPTVWASNYSTGVNALFWLTRKAAEILGTDFDLEVVEMHHRMKKDAPSGTATTLGEILAEVRGLQVKEALRRARKGAGDRDDRTFRSGTLRNSGSGEEGADCLGFKLFDGRECAVLADTQSNGNSGAGFRFGSDRDASSHEEGCAEWDGGDVG